MKKILTSLFAIAMVASAFSGAIAQEKLGLSFGFASGFTSEFGGLGSTIYKEEAAAEALADVTKAGSTQLAALGLTNAANASYDGDKGGSLIALVPEIFVRYDITETFFVKTGFSYGATITGGEWSAKNIAQTFTAETNDGSNGLGGSSTDAAILYDVENKYELTTMEIPLMVGINLPLGDFGHVYSSVGLKYTNIKLEKNFALTVTKDTSALSSTAVEIAKTTDLALDKYAQQDTATKYSKDFWSIQAVWSAGIDAKVMDDLYVFIEREYSTSTDSFSSANESLGNGGSKPFAPAIVSGTCDYYKVGVRYSM